MARASERGQVLPLLLFVLVLATGAAVIVVEVGVAMAERTRAQTAADAAALAGAVDGPAAAQAAATTNGASLTGYRDDGALVQVAVRYRRARTVAAADAPQATLGVAPIVVAALARAEALLGHRIAVVSAAGVTVEVSPETASALLMVAASTGLCQQSGEVDPVHFGPCPPSHPR